MLGGAVCRGGSTAQSGASAPPADTVPQTHSSSTGDPQEAQRLSSRCEKEEQRRALREARLAHARAKSNTPLEDLEFRLGIWASACVGTASTPISSGPRRHDRTRHMRRRH